MRIIPYVIFFLVLVAGFTGAMLYYGNTHPAEMKQAFGIYAEDVLSPEEEAREKARKEEREAQRLAEEAAEKERAAHIDRLREGMERIDAGVYTWYSYPEEKELSGGLYVRPLLGHSRDCTFRCNILYYYSIHESSHRAWIFGDRFAIEADGVRRTWELDEKKRRDRLAKDVESLTERYQIALGEDGADILRRAAFARTVRCIYWSSADGKSVSCTLTTEEKRRLQNMMALYDLWQESR